jgi:predicted pyridoxine 5'-phosphate oxidase superfamily flavin-nucleotide-binding protein
MIPDIAGYAPDLEGLFIGGLLAQPNHWGPPVPENAASTNVPRNHTSDVAFTPTVKAIQARKGSRHGYAKMEERGGWQSVITPDLAAFIGAQTSVFLATANAAGQPYIQHRGGPAGFLHVLDGNTIGFADFSGNRQYITQGNLADNPKAHLFLIDYANRRRVKIWGEARVVENDAELMSRLMPQRYAARPEQAILFTVEAWDSNCPQHIPQRFEAADVAAALDQRDRRIAELESEIERLRAAAPQPA